MAGVEAFESPVPFYRCVLSDRPTLAAWEAAFEGSFQTRRSRPTGPIAPATKLTTQTRPLPCAAAAGRGDDRWLCCTYLLPYGFLSLLLQHVKGRLVISRI